MDARGLLLPSLDELGRDLLLVSNWRKALSLLAPFFCAGLFFVLGRRGLWIGALACPVVVSFLTYGSISHDLVHRTLRLPSWLNEPLLSALELIALRSGHAYRVSHLYHHSRFPAEDDLEGASARRPWWRAIPEGMTLQPRLWWFALKRPGPHRAWVFGEGAAIFILLLVSLAAFRLTPLPALYCGMTIAGSWIFPLATVVIPHHAGGEDVLTQTRLFRGRLLSLLAFEHLYHLEHHLYPQVPHHNWPALARRLDPHFARPGLQPIKLLF